MSDEVSFYNDIRNVVEESSQTIDDFADRYSLLSSDVALIYIDYLCDRFKLYNKSDFYAGFSSFSV